MNSTIERLETSLKTGNLVLLRETLCQYKPAFVQYNGDNLNVVRLLCEYGIPMDMRVHCKLQNTDIVDYLLDQGYNPSSNSITEVVINNCIYLMDKFLQYKINVDYSYLLELARNYGHTEIANRILAYNMHLSKE